MPRPPTALGAAAAAAAVRATRALSTATTTLPPARRRPAGLPPVLPPPPMPPLPPARVPSRAAPLRVAVGMSGGVDSSVTAALLVAAGFDVVGVFMRTWDAADEAGAGLARAPCPADADWASARAVADALRIPLRAARFDREYWTAVFLPWLETYAAGGTPNPDVACNRFVKFGAFRAAALAAAAAAGAAGGPAPRPAGVVDGVHRGA
jgi:hypothetical protein